MLLPKRKKTNDLVAVWGCLRVDFRPVVSAVNPQQDVMLARYKEAAARADDTIDAQREAIAAQRLTMETQRQIIGLLHEQIGRLEQQVEELKIALRTAA